jgi:hypothetical protein
MYIKESELQVWRINEAREWLDEMGIVLASADLNDSYRPIRLRAEQLGVVSSEDRIPSCRSEHDLDERVA